MKKTFLAFIVVLIAAGLFAGCLSFGVPAEAELNQGIDAYGAEDWHTAIAKFTRAIGKKPNYGKAYNGRGWAYLMTGDFVRAEKDFNAALRINPSDYNAQDGLYHIRAPHAAYLLVREGDATYKDGNKDLAIEKYSQAISLFPDYSSAYNSRGYAYLNKKMYNEAEADFKKTVTIDPEFARGYANLGMVYENRGEYDKAEEYLNRAIKMNPALTYASYELGSMKAAQVVKAKKEVWDRRIAATSYPAPFEGTWKYVIPGYTIPASRREGVRTVKEWKTSHSRPSSGGSSGYYDGSTWNYPSSRMESYTEFIPEKHVLERTFTLEFRGKSFKSKSNNYGFEEYPSHRRYGFESKEASGMFYYDGDRIELEDGMVLWFAGGVITDSEGRKYMK
jgi:tetratricopeptide (TPR) repeat protein